MGILYTFERFILKEILEYYKQKNDYYRFYSIIWLFYVTMFAMMLYSFGDKYKVFDLVTLYIYLFVMMIYIYCWHGWAKKLFRLKRISKNYEAILDTVMSELRNAK